MEAWVIKNKNGEYYWFHYWIVVDEANATKNLLEAELFDNEKFANQILRESGLKDCKIVKVRIEEVEE